MGFVGKIGERRDFNLTFVNQVIVQTKPWTFIDFCLDEAGNKIVYQGKGSGLGPMTRGQEFRIRATVKEHREIEGRKETVIIRPKTIKGETMKSRKRLCPVCGKEMRKIETCYSTPGEKKTAWTCDAGRETDHDLIVYIIEIKK